MIKVQVVKNNQVNSEAVFQTEEQATAWVDREIENNSWGLADRWISFQGAPESGYSNTRTVEGRTEYFYPAQYTVHYYDVSAETTAKEESDAALKFLQETDYKILRHNGQLALGIATTMTHSQYLTLEQQRQAARAKVL